MSTLTDSQRNTRAQRKLIRDCIGNPGFAFHVQTARRVVHVAIHDGDGSGSSLTFTEKQFDGAVESMLRHVRAPETLPTVAQLLRNETWRERREIDRLNGELQTLRWRILHLEREASERRPAYSDFTALAIVPPAPVVAQAATEREMTFRDDRGVVRFGLVDREKGWCEPLAKEGGAL